MGTQTAQAQARSNSASESSAPEYGMGSFVGQSAVFV